ncbi:hypothetical protein ABPG72_020871, partial [Tetrahymena utriculariae]
NLYCSPSFSRTRKFEFYEVMSNQYSQRFKRTLATRTDKKKEGLQKQNLFIDFNLVDEIDITMYKNSIHQKILINWNHFNKKVANNIANFIDNFIIL